VTAVGPYRFTTTGECYDAKPFLDNGRFTLLKATVGVQIAGNDVIFAPEIEDYDKFYRTRFGPVFHTGARIYGATNHNLRYALRRLTDTRPNSFSGYTHHQLIDNSHRFVYTHKKFLTDYGFELQFHMPVLYDIIEANTWLVLQPHMKKKPRQAAWKKILDMNRVGDYSWVKMVKGNVKREEWAKFGKKPRMVNDLTVLASLLGAIVTSKLKHAMESVPFKYKGATAYFIGSPRPEKLTEAFHNLIDEQSTQFIFFSDDSCIGVTHNGRRYIYNVDISSCDTSHTESTFDMLKMISRGHDRSLIRRLIAQCEAPLKIVTRSRRQSVVLEPNTPVLYSGSTLTTLINNLANLTIFMSIVDNNCFSPVQMMRAAEEAGYIITLERCETIADVQFLKHSPAKIDGKYVGVLNLGVIMRSSGTCKLDLPGRKTQTLRERGLNFQGSLMQCYKFSPQHDLIRALTPPDFRVVPVSLDSYLINELTTIEKSVYEVPISHFLDRYRITLHDYHELIALSRSASFGDIIYCNASHAILDKDYKLAPVRNRQ